VRTSVFLFLFGCNGVQSKAGLVNLS
jgi:hypothetical protein